MKHEVHWTKRRPTLAGDYLLAIENTSKGNPNKRVCHVVIHANGALTTPPLYDGTQPNVILADHLKARAWAMLPPFPL